MARIDQAPGLQEPFISNFPQPVISRRSPTANDKKFPLGMRWINKASNEVWTLTSVSSGRAEWDFHSVQPDNVSLTFGQSPILQTSLDTGGPPQGVITAINLMHLQKGVAMEQFLISAQTIIAPRMTTSGLLISLDTEIAKGVEYNFGAARENCVPSFIIGTAAAFFFEVDLLIGKIDTAGPYLIGFRKVQANQQAFLAYTDYATIGMSNSSSTTNISTLSAVNGSGSVTITNKLWGGDGASNLLRVSVSGSGIVTYTINGEVPSGAGAVTFDTGDIITPFIHLLHSSNAAEGIFLKSMKFGFQA